MKDCFGLHSTSAFGYGAQKQSGVGQQSLLSQVQLTDIVHWLQSGKIVDILRCAAEIHKLAFLLPHCLGRLRGLRPRPAALERADQRLTPLILLFIVMIWATSMWMIVDAV